jgi:hypothetical protein
MTHNLSLYKHSSGGLVFGAGTVQWSWGLDNNHGRGRVTELHYAGTGLLYRPGCKHLRCRHHRQFFRADIRPNN